MYKKKLLDLQQTHGAKESEAMEGNELRSKGLSKLKDDFFCVFEMLRTEGRICETIKDPTLNE
eukprot:5104794-Prorocentrum_lima.AAC.1